MSNAKELLSEKCLPDVVKRKEEQQILFYSELKAKEIKCGPSHMNVNSIKVVMKLHMKGQGSDLENFTRFKNVSQRRKADCSWKHACLFCTDYGVINYVERIKLDYLNLRVYVTVTVM